MNSEGAEEQIPDPGKKKAEEMAKQKSLFIDGANKLGFNAKKAEEVFDLSYWFNLDESRDNLWRLFEHKSRS